MIGNTLDATERRPGVEWYHSAQDAVAMVRDYTKWDDAPISLQHFAESAVRAYRISMTPPREPVVIVLDSALRRVRFRKAPLCAYRSSPWMGLRRPIPARSWNWPSSWSRPRIRCSSPETACIPKRACNTSSNSPKRFRFR